MSEEVCVCVCMREREREREIFPLWEAWGFGEEGSALLVNKWEKLQAQGSLP